MTFKKWKEQADMPRTDSLGQWYDAETGLYFDRSATPAIDQQLYQFWGRRVSFIERKDRLIIVSIQNSRMSVVGQRVIRRELFDGRPAGNNEQVEWACGIVGISLK